MTPDEMIESGEVVQVGGLFRVGPLASGEPE
jgi:predicted RecA/RadA family phage recombinase